MAVVNLNILGQELSEDPLAYGWSGMNDNVAATTLNVVNRTRDRTDFTLAELLNALNADISEFTALTIQKETRLWRIVDYMLAGVMPINLDAKAMLETIFASGDIHDAFVDLKTETVSRAVEIGAVAKGQQVSAEHVKQARARVQ